VTAIVGEVRELRLVEGLTRTQIVQYAGASGDFNPLHTDEVFARESAGYPTVFAHGMLTMGMTGRVLTDWFGAENVVAYSARFVAQVWPGDSLTARAVIDSVADRGDHRELTLSVTTANQRSESVLSGTAVVRQPVLCGEPHQRLERDV
jgi:acyl dehydratase